MLVFVPRGGAAISSAEVAQSDFSSPVEEAFLFYAD